MAKNDLEHIKDVSNKYDTIVETFKSLPVNIQKTVAEKLQRYVNDEDVYEIINLSDHIECVCYSVDEIKEYLQKNAGIPKVDKSNIYKAIRQERPNVYGYKIIITKEKL
jgi:hypothetical protein